jgi:hypothetical protein
LEGALMISRIDANDGALTDARNFLNEYLEEKVRARKRGSSRKRVS